MHINARETGPLDSKSNDDDTEVHHCTKKVYLAFPSKYKQEIYSFIPLPTSLIRRQFLLF